MARHLPSFHFFPVRIVSWGKTVMIEESRVRFQYRGLRSLFQQDRELPISSFRCVEIAGKTHIDEAYADGTTFESVLVSVKLLHASSRLKNVLLARDTFDVDHVTEKQVEPLQKVWADAATALSLPALDAGVRENVREPVKSVKNWLSDMSKG